MKRTASRIFFVLLFLSMVLAGCAAARKDRPTPAFQDSDVRKTGNPSRPEGAKEQDGELFRTLAARMDEYQDLTVVCDSLAELEENKEMRDSCNVKLKALREELIDLSNRLQVKPD